MSKTAKHRSKPRWLRYPLKAYIFRWKNYWYAFTKPRLKQLMRRGK